jgi:hypothetical protein
MQRSECEEEAKRWRRGRGCGKARRMVFGKEAGVTSEELLPRKTTQFTPMRSYRLSSENAKILLNMEVQYS